MFTSVRSFRPCASRRSGFTLLEILVVLAIIGMLVGVLVKNVGGAFETGQDSTAKIFVGSSIKTSIMRYRIDVGDFPTTAEGLEALVSAPAGKADKWKGPYLEGGKVPLDPWGKPYGYRYPATRNKSGYDVFSPGRDGLPETADDVGNWE